MPLNTKDEVEQKDNPDPAEPAPVELPEVEAATGEELPLDEAVRANATTAARADENGAVAAGFADAHEDRIAQLEERVEQQEAVIQELIEVMELLGSAVENNHPGSVRTAKERVGAAGSDAWPWMWEDETFKLKQRRYE